MTEHAWEVHDWAGEKILRCGACRIHGPADDRDWKVRKDAEGCVNDSIYIAPVEDPGPVRLNDTILRILERVLEADAEGQVVALTFEERAEVEGLLKWDAEQRASTDGGPTGE